jgi:uncharacterized cupredoxin-like copper-binding protein
VSVRLRWSRSLRLASSACVTVVIALPLCAAPRANGGPPVDPARASLSSEAADHPTLDVEAAEATGDRHLTMDRLAVPSGDVTVRFTNRSTIDDGIFVYPTQDTTALLAALRHGTSRVPIPTYLKNLAGQAGPVAPGSSMTVTMMALAPGLYEISSYTQLTGLDGSTKVAHDEGEFLTFAVTGAGIPEGLAAPSSIVVTTMKAGSYGAWLFIPDHLVLKAGDVTFVALNEMNESHDLVISPIGDVSAFIETRLAEGQADYKRINGLELMSDLSPRRTASTTVALAPGIYVAACYMVSKATDGTLFVHSDRGQRFTFRVVE